MLKHSVYAVVMSMGLLLPTVTQASDAWPNQSIRFIVPYPPGGPTDLMARLIAEPLSKKLGVNVIVENKAGASGNIGSAEVAKSKPNGNTILLAASGNMSVNQTLFKNLQYDPIKDFAPIIQISKFPLVLEVSEKNTITSVQEYIDFSKANPESVTFGSAGNGSPQHLGGELFKKVTGASLQHVPYKGAGPALTDLMGGHITSMFDILGSSMQHIQGGVFRPLAVTTAKRSAQLPNVPTMQESGVDGFDYYAWHGIVAAAGTPEPIIVKYNTALNEIFQDPEFAKKWEGIGSEVVGGTPEQFMQLVVSEADRLGVLVKELNIQLD
ncbi:tripartite tricarboxylate transporter substrate binding protein [Pusillimonas sp. ANT_WB101]|nr:tripartite tricarboxylate transporter substrate binding protein [Pusillimonas sp. ANT_WB101]KAA0892950.1 tripartite tricarboxylate transporter substrate binding protein [Pusillimonas sp. ANT_WB101]